jgi:tripartite-type tricarboxylate transporter receptor subunit TctC
VRHAVLATMDADLKAKLAENGMEVVTSTPDELKRQITQDIKVQPNWSKPVDWCHSQAGKW